MLVISREDNWKGKLSKKKSALEQLEYMLVFNVWGRHKSAVHILILQASALANVSLLSQICRNCKPRNRPSFRQILLHLDIASADVLSTPQETYFKSQVGSPFQSLKVWQCTDKHASRIPLHK